MQQKCISNSSKGWEVQEQGSDRFDVWGRPTSGSQKADILLCPYTVKGDKRVIWGLFYKSTNISDLMV